MSRPLHDRLAVDTLLSMSQEQLARLGDYLDSPYFPIRPECRELFRLLEREVLHGGKDLDEETLYQYLFPGEAFQSQKLNRYFFLLLETLMDFMSEEQFQRHRRLRQVMALDELLVWRMDHPYKRKYKKLMTKLQEEEMKSEENRQLLIRFRLGYTAFRLRNPNREEVLDILEQAYREQQGLAYLTNLKLYAAMLNRSLIAGVSWEQALPSPPGETAELTQPLVGLYECVIAMRAAERKRAASKALEKYWELKAGLEQHRQVLEESELIDLGSYGLNFCTLWSPAADLDFDPRQEQYDWYHLLIEGMISLGRVDWWHFYNYATLLVTEQKNHQAVFQLIDRVEGRLAGDSKDSAVTYVRGLVPYASGDFRTAKLIFNQLKGEARVPLIQIHSRLMFIRSIFELGEYQAVEYDHQALRQFLSRMGRSSSEISKERLKTFEEFTRLIRKLCKEMLKEKPVFKRLEKLEGEIAEAATSSKAWLLSKVREAIAQCKGGGK